MADDVAYGEVTMDGLDVAILAVASYLAVSALVRLMLARQRGVAEQFHAEMRASRRRQQGE